MRDRAARLGGFRLYNNRDRGSAACRNHLDQEWKQSRRGLPGRLIRPLLFSERIGVGRFRSGIAELAQFP